MSKAFVRRSSIGISRGRYLLSALFLLIVIILSFSLYDYFKDQIVKDSSFPTRAVQIKGKLVHVTKKEIADVIGLLAGNENIATLDLNKVHNALLQIAWVDKVFVQKQLPDTIVVTVKEHVASALWCNDGLYDATAKQVFYPNMNNFKQSLVRLSATHDDLAPEVYNHAVSFLPLLRSANLQMIALELDSIRTLRLTLSNKVVIVLGRDDDNGLVLRRLNNFLAVYKAGKFNFDNVNYVDLRYDVGFAVGMHTK